MQQTENGSTPDAAEPQSPPRVRRWRWRRALVVLLVLLVALVLLGPTIAAPIVRGRIVAGIEESLKAKASLGELSFGLGGSVHAGDFVLAALDGRTVASAASFDAKIDVLGAVRGRYDAEVTLDGFELHLWRDQGADWNVVEMLPEPGPEETPAAAEPAPLPEVRAKVQLRNGSVFVHGPEGTTQLAGVTFTLDVAELSAAAPFELALAVLRDGTPAGAVRVGGECTLAVDGVLPPDGLRAQLHASLEELAVAAVGRELDGRLAGRLDLAVEPGLAVRAGADLALSEFRYEPVAESGAPVHIPRAGLSVEASVDAAGSGAQRVLLDVPDVLRLSLDAETRDLRGARGTATGKVVIDGPIPGLATLAAAFVPLRRELSFEGALSASTDWNLRTADGALADGSLAGSMKLVDFGARDAGGESIALDEIRDLELGFAAALGAERSSFEVTVPRGPVTLHGTAVARGVPAGVADVETANVDFAADLDRLASLAARVADLGGVELGGRIDGRAEARPNDGIIETTGRLDVRDLVLRNLPAEGERRGLGPLALAIAHEGSLDADGRADIRSLVVEAPGLRLEASGSAASSSELALRVATRLVPGELVAAARPFIGDAVGFGGQPLEGVFDVSLANDQLRAAGDLKGERLVVALPPAEGETRTRTYVQQDLAIGVALGADLGTRRMTIDGLTYGSRTAEASLQGTVDALEEPAADLTLSLSGSLDRLLADLVQLDGYEGKGDVSARYAITQRAGKLDLAGVATVKDLELTLPAEPGVAGRTKIADPALSLDLGLALESGRDELVIERCVLANGILWGTTTGRVRGLGTPPMRVEGLVGDLHYVPDRLGAALGRWLPGDLAGSTPQPLAFRFDGLLSELEPLDLVRSLQGTASVGVDRFSMLGLATDGLLQVEAKGDTLVTKGSFGANQGTLTVDASLDLRQAAATKPSSTLRVGFDGVRTNPDLGQVLGYVHPAFAAIDRAAAGAISGLVRGELELRYDAPLSNAAMTGGWDALPKAPINASGRLEVRGASFAGSPLVSQLLGLFGADAASSVELDPVAFEIRAGRVGYSEPWQWTIAGSKTTFAGTIGLDRTLALRWSVPVSDALIARHAFLRSFAGETIEVPIGGTVDRPELQLAATLQGLARTAVERELKGRLDKQIGDTIGDILGGKKPGPAADPNALLRDADRLYGEGKKQEAAAIYERIRTEFKLTLVYLLNRPRIDARAREK